MKIGTASRRAYRNVAARLAGRAVSSLLRRRKTGAPGWLTKMANRGVPRKLRRSNVSGKRVSPLKPLMVRSMGGGAPSMSYFTHRFRPDRRAKLMKRVGAPNVYVTNNSLRIQAAEGFQQSGDFRWTGVDHLTKIRDLITNAPAQLWRNGGQYVLESLQGELLLTNSSLATCYVDIYDLTFKRDWRLVTGDPDTDQIPSALWSNEQFQTNGTPVPSDYQMINSLPTDSAIFKDFLSIKRRIHVALAQGATHRHKISHKFTKVVDNAYLAALGSSGRNSCSKDYTSYTMIVVYGQPAALKNGDQVTTTTAAIALDCVQSWRYKYTFVEDKSNQFNAVDNLFSLAGEQIVNIGSGAIETNAVIYP